MTRILWYAVVLLLTVSSVSAFEDYSATSYLDLDASWTGRLSAETGSDPRLSSLEARVTIVPDGYTTEPDSYEEDGTLVFKWDELRSSYTYTISAEQRTELFGGLSRSEPWPVAERDEQAESDLLDYNDPDVRAFASRIAQGETDALRLAVRVAEAVREEITYNLTTLNAEATYPASEVLARGEGVCDEITVLYIATMRALGVPARYVSGYAFTNIFEDDGSWEGHGWAEVRINGEWVPFDLTYAEYVHLSPAHLPLRRTNNAESSSVKYTWYGNDVDIAASSIETDIRITGTGSDVRFGDIDARFVHDRVGPGWNELEITVTNELDSFIAPILRLSRTQGLELEREAVLIVPPQASRTITIPVGITERLRPRYEYTFPVSVEARGFEQARASFLSSTRDPSYEEPEADEDERAFHPDLSFSCTDVLGLPGTEAESSCDLFNTGNRDLDLRVCGESCTSVTLLIGERTSIEVPIELGTGLTEETIRIIGDVRGETTISANGRAPAQVSLEAEGTGREIDVRIESTEPVNGTIRITIGSETLEGPFEDSTFTVPSESFGLRGHAHVEASYEDVDGAHTIERDAQVSQNVIEWISSRLEALFSLT